MILWSLVFSPQLISLICGWSQNMWTKKVQHQSSIFRFQNNNILHVFNNHNQNKIIPNFPYICSTQKYIYRYCFSPLPIYVFLEKFAMNPVVKIISTKYATITGVRLIMHCNPIVRSFECSWVLWDNIKNVVWIGILVRVCISLVWVI